MPIKPRNLVVDTSAFYALYDEEDRHHKITDSFFEVLASGELSYKTVFTHRYILAEIATLLLYRTSHKSSVTALSEIINSGLQILEVDKYIFNKAKKSFEKYSDQSIGYVDHITAVLANQNNIDTVVGFDEDFRTLGFKLAPQDLSFMDTRE